MPRPLFALAAALPLASLACAGSDYPAVVMIGGEVRPLAVAGDPVPTGEMVLVPAGSFLRGCSPADDSCFDNEHPARAIHLDAFYLDRTEVTVAAYRSCVAAGACSTEGLGQHSGSRTTSVTPGQGHNTTEFDPAASAATCNYTARGREGHPINCVSWHQAQAFCAWAGKRLPTEAEWEKAARGRDDRIYPWGNAPPSCSLAVMDGGCGKGGTARVGSRPRGMSPAGALDMSGNVTEWVSDWYGVDDYAGSPAHAPRGPSTGRFRVVRGGTWRNAVEGKLNALRNSNRYSYIPTAHLDYVGFRCAADPR
jgi:formylglycine-generating enzyme required for sulfatase activity